MRLVGLRDLAAGALLMAAAIASPAQGLDASWRLSQYRVEAFGAAEGMPSLSVNCIVQTPDGDLWIGTGNGLVRFDGLTFELFDRQTTPTFAGTEVRTLHVDRQGRLWIGFNFGGLGRREGDGFVAVGPPELLVWTIVEGAHGLLIGTSTGIFEVVDEGVVPLPAAQPLGPIGAVELAVDRDGRLWAAALGDSLFAFAGERVAFEQGEGHDSLLTAPAMVGDRDGRLLAWRQGRLERWETDAFVPVPLTLPPAAVPPRRLFVDTADSLWITLPGDAGLARWSAGRLELMPDGHPVVVGRYVPMLEDREGNLWLGSYSRGLLRLSSGPVRTWTTAEGLPDDSVRGLLEDGDGSLWVGTVAGLTHLQGAAREQVTVYTQPLGTPGRLLADRIYGLVRLADGSFAVGSQGGLHRFARGRLVTYRPVGRGFDQRVFSLLVARDGAVWVGTGVVVADDGRSPLVRIVGDRATDVPVPDGIVFQLREDRAGAIWASTNQGIVEVPPHGPPVPHPLPGMAAQPYVLASTIDSRGDLWFATIQDGIARWRGGRLERLRLADGLPVDGITALIDDGRGYLWLGSSKGLSRIALADLDARLAGERPDLPYRQLAVDDGMRATSVIGGFDGGALQTRDGHLWFATLSGLAEVDLSRLPAVARPAARLEHLWIDGAAQPLANGVDLAPGRYRLDLDFTAIHLRAPKRLQFRYRMLGVDPDWVLAGARRHAEYPALPPGRHRFEVAASVDGASWGDATSLPVSIAPYWWQRPWFPAAAAFALLTVGAGLQRTRQRRVVRRAAELEGLVDFGRSVTGVLDPEELGRQLLRALAARFGDGPRLLGALREGRPPWTQAAGWPTPPAVELSAALLAGWRRPRRVDGEGEAPALMAQLWAADLGAAAPLVSGETTFGLLAVAKRDVGPADLAALGALAAQVTMALEGAWQAQAAMRWQNVSEARREWLETDLVGRLAFAALARLGVDTAATAERVVSTLAVAMGEGTVLTASRVNEAVDRLLARGIVDLAPDGSLRVARERWTLLPELRQPLAEIARQATTRLGAYQLAERIGVGGMGEVFRGVSLHDGSLAAVKVLFAHQTVDPEARRRLAREGELVAAIRHPNVVRLLERGESEGRLYLAMELLTGETLASRLRRGALGVEGAVAAGRQLASALAALHSRGVVHRDLTAGNVMCEPDGRYVLLDFGLARGLDNATVTRGLAVLGTLPYMSPEQLRGEDVDARTDLWSLGVVLHEMATGALPWEAAVTVRMAIEILGETRPPLRRLDGLSPDLAGLIADLLEPDRGRRPGEAAEVLRRLAALAAARTIVTS